MKSQQSPGEDHSWGSLAAHVEEDSSSKKATVSTETGTMGQNSECQGEEENAKNICCWQLYLLKKNSLNIYYVVCIMVGIARN